MGQAMSAANAPPPLPNASGAAFYAAINGAQAGPFTFRDLAAKMQSGEITRQTLVWKQGMGNWTAAESVSDLAELFAGPPPLPKNP